MDFVPPCIKIMGAVALLAMSIAFDLGQSAPTNEHDAVSIVLDSGLSPDTFAPIEPTAGEISLADRHCAPGCPAGCAHPASVSCCASVAVGSSSAFPVVITAGTVVPYEADQSLSGVEPDGPQEPPQLSA